MNKITKNILWGLILGSPVGLSFAANNAYMEKINQVTQALNTSLHTKYDLPAVSQYLSGGGGAAPSTPSSSIPSSGTPSGSSTPPSTSGGGATTPNETTPSTSGGSWYVQPGDTGSSGSGSSGTGGFDYSNLY